MKKCLQLLLVLLPVCGWGQVITTVAGGGTSFADSGAATSINIGYTGGISFDYHGFLYVADANHNKVRKIDLATGTMVTIAGNGSAGFSGDGGAATAAGLNNPQFITFDRNNNLYISDVSNRRIRKVDVYGTISTFGGMGTMGSGGDGGPATAAQLFTPQGLVFDHIGNLYVVDLGAEKIRKIDTSASHIISVVAGNGSSGFSGDSGPATAAKLGNPEGITVDASGNLFFADYNNNRIRSINLSSGIINTSVGCDTGGYSGDGISATSAQLNGPFGVVFDTSNNMLIGDMVNNRVRKIDTTDIISTVAGIGSSGFSGDGGPSSAAQINKPTGVAIDECQNLFFVDQQNRRIRKVTFNTSTTDTPTLTLTASTPDTICAGTSVTYTATHTLGGSYNIYQWYVNATAISGATDSLYTYTPVTGDSVYCFISTWNRCSSISYDTSNIIHMVVNPLVTPTITISPSPNDTVCAGTSVIYTATVSGGGSGPGYQWKVNGSNVGTSAAGYTYTPTNGDTVQCVFTSNAACATDTVISSNTINMVVNVIVTPTISIAPIPNDTVCSGTAVTYMATIAGGGSAPVYAWYVNGVIASTTGSSYTYSPANGDSARCVLGSSALCVSSAFVGSSTINMVVNVITHPTVTVAGPSVETIGNPVTIAATLTGAGSSYVIHWFNFGTEFTSTTVPSVTYTKVMTDDSITAKIVSNDFCVDSAVSGYQLVGVDKTSTSLLPSPEGVTCYPNPVLGELHVVSPYEMDAVTITDLLGREVYRNSEKGNGEYVLNTASLPPGIYIVKVFLSTGGVSFLKLMKE